MGLEEYVRADEAKEEVAVVHLINQSTGKRIDLVGAIHIGSQKYYNSVKKLLENCNAILYESVSPSSNTSSLRKRFIFSNNIHLSEFYRKIAESVTKHHTREISDAVKKASREDPDRTYFFIKYGNKLIEELELVFQGDAIDYNNLPQNWYHADLTHDEINKKIKIFSKDNLAFGILKLISNVVIKYQWVMDKLVESIVTNGFISKRKNKNFILHINRAREAKVYEQVERLEQSKDINYIGIFYGAGHLPHLEKGLMQREYIREGIEYLEIHRKQSKDWENI